MQTDKADGHGLEAHSPEDTGADLAFLDALNPEQREAVLHTEGPLLILAGAGSGKTRVIASRVAYLVQSGLAQPWEVLAVTFTNKAAEEMRGRVAALIGERARDLWVSTFHALCARLLRREAPAIGLSRDFVIYDSTDQLAAVKQVMRSLNIDEKTVQPRAVLGRISHAKNRMEGPDDIEGFSYRDDQFRKVYQGYVDALRDASALDFDDLLLRTVELFEHDGVRSRYQRQFRYVMVDEYQDTNRPQYLLVSRLVATHHNLAVVGDPDQSIYKWRGAALRNILDFERDFPEAEVVRLERNYRSTQTILDAASAVISRNRNRKEKRLWTDRAGGDPLTYFRGDDELEEASFLGRTLRAELAARRGATVAVLYRLNSQSRVLEDQLMRDGTPYRIIGGVRFYERKEIKDALAYLKLIVNPHDDVSLRRVINVPARGIGKMVMDTLEQTQPGQAHEAPPLVAAGLYEIASARSLWARAQAVVAERRLSSRGHTALSTFMDTITSLTAMARNESVSMVLATLLDRTGYLKALRDEQTDEAEARAENLAELVSAAREYETRDPEPSVGGFVDRLSLLSEADEAQGSESARVWLMTMHAAKGLEFPVVAIAGLEDGLFPHSRSFDDPEEMEEERRLCYVGMTRAQQKLILTSAGRRRVFGEYQGTVPSRFLEEIPPALVLEIPSYGSSRPTTATGRTASWQTRVNPYARRPARQEATRQAYRPEDEDQSGSDGARPGRRVRHAQFGVGTILSVEGEGADMKLTVRFATVGQKKLVARYANLQPA
jgi:DNA helicase II / ATP-dependent DNA helicase PcrA